MRYGASTFIWVSPFSNKTLDLVDRIKEFGFDLIEICIEDPGTIDPSAIRARATRVGLGVTVCGAFGPERDLSSEDEAVRTAGMAYLRRCIDLAQDLGSPFVSGPMYAAVGNTRLLPDDARRAQWNRSVCRPERGRLHRDAAEAAEQDTGCHRREGRDDEDRDPH